MSATSSVPASANIAGGLLTVDLAAIQSNYRWLADAVAPTQCAGVVKADAYGLGASMVAPALYRAGCRAFFVAHLAEALTLRADLPADTTLWVLNGLQPGGEATCAEAGFIPVLNGMEQVEAWALEADRRSGTLPAAMQIDSGMSRLGLSRGEIDSLAARPDVLRRFDLRLVMSHLACADEPDHPANERQLATFQRLSAKLPTARVSFANSGGCLLDARYHHDLVRPGVGLYGVSPAPGRGQGLRPVVSLEARVIQVRSIVAGTAVGYGADFIAAEAMRIATIAVGYADGWSRHLSNKGAAFFDAVRLPIVGRVSMDSITLDVSALPEGSLRLGSLVELIGPHQTLEVVAASCGTIPYEIVTSLGRRYARRYIGDADSSG